MEIYAKGVIGNAWQYDGDIESMPDWVKDSSRHHIEIGKNGVVRYWRGEYSVPVDKGDWFVKIHSDTPRVYSDDAFKQNFTFSNPDRCKTGSVASEKYRSKPVTVYAWQYTGQSDLLELPYWIADLVLHHKLGYHPMENSDKELFQFFYEGVWVTLLDGDWLVRYGEDSLEILSDADFKEYFEEIK